MVRHRGRHGGGGGGGGGGAPQGAGGPDRIFADASYWDARVLQVAVVLDVFSLLSDGPATAEDVAVRLATDRRATELLLNALVEIGYLAKRADRFSNAPHAQAYLVRGTKDYVGWTLLVEAQAWNVWGHLEQSVKTGKPAPGVLYEDDLERSRALLRSLHARAEKLFTRHVAEKVRLEGAEKLLDLGGGMGSYTIAFCRRNPKIEATIFDLPYAIEMAKETVGKTDVHKRVKYLEGDYHTDAIGGPWDVVFLSSVIHTESEENARALLKKVHESLEPGGHVVLRDMFMNPERTGPAGAVFSLNMLLNTQAGRCYATSEVDRFLKDAGFEKVQMIEPGLLMDARKPGPARLGVDQPRGAKEPKAERKPGPRPAEAKPAPEKAEEKPEPAAPESAKPAEGAAPSGDPPKSE